MELERSFAYSLFLQHAARQTLSSDFEIESEGTRVAQIPSVRTMIILIFLIFQLTDHKGEFPRHRLRFSHILGEGNFGQVSKNF